MAEKINPENDPEGWIDAMTPEEAKAFMEGTVEIEFVGTVNGRPMYRPALRLTVAQGYRIMEKAKLA